VPRRSSPRVWILGTLVLLVGVAGLVSYLFWRQSVPGVRVTGTPPSHVGPKTPLPLVLEATRGNVVEAEVRVVQGGTAAAVARQQTPAPRVELTATFDASAGLQEGGATLEVWARDDFWRPLSPAQRALVSAPVTLDFTPPKIEILTLTPYVSPGGAGIVVFRAGDASRAETRVGALAFPTFPLGPAGTRVGFFALPHDFGKGAGIVLTAEDEARNSASRGIAAEVLPRRFRADTVEITDAFLQAKVPELLPQHPPSQPLLGAFLTINRDQRRQAEEEKRRVAARTQDRPLWEGAFLQPRNTQVFSNFAEARTYRYQGRAVDRQIHFGYDLASTKRAAVPAANNGVIAFAGPLTIYGNTIIVDHGLGLMTLYAHLSTIEVKVGDRVDKGQVIGRTGTTGLATGDHLHYEVLVHGVSVTPLEWWDAKWIRDRIGGPLRTAGLPDLDGSDGRAQRPGASPPRTR